MPHDADLPPLDTPLTPAKPPTRHTRTGKSRGSYQKKLTPLTVTEPTATNPTGLPIGRMICAFVRQGAYPKVAAQACGVDAEEYLRWETQAKRGGPLNKPFRDFQKELKSAQAQARVKAEIAVLDNDAKTWLRSGPGREKQGEPGWSQVVKPVMHSVTNTTMLASPEWNGLWCLLLKALKDHPEARAALIEAMQSFEPDKVVNAIAPKPI